MSNIKTNFFDIILTVVFVTVAFTLITCRVNTVFSILLLTWLFFFFFFMMQWESNISMIGFLFTFFVFLMGREVYYNYTLSNKYYIFYDEFSTLHAYKVMLISLVVVCTSYMIFKKVGLIKKRSINLAEGYLIFTEYFRYISKLAFYITYIFMLVDVLFEAIHVSNVGYVESYSANAGSAGTPWIVAKLSMLSSVALFCFLGTLPTKKETNIPIVLYAFYGLLTLLTGQRYPVVAVFLTIIIYYFVRNNEDGNWVRRYHYIVGALAIPFAVIGLLAVDAIRLGGVFSFTNVLDDFIDFFAVQGGSINVIKCGKYFENQIPHDRLYTINSILFNIFNTNPYNSNTLEYAQFGHSFSAIMTVLEYGESEYLAGHGTGTSYIAELYHDFGYFGIVLGNIIYGFSLNLIQNIKKGTPIINTFLLLMISPLFFSPRGEFDGFIGVTFRRGNVIFVILILLVTILYMNSTNKKELY